MLNFIHTQYGLAPYPVAKENTLLSGLHLPSYYVENIPGQLILNDYNSLSGVVDYILACKEHNKKPIIGCKFLDEDGKSINLVAKNTKGYKNLLHLVSRSNDSDRYNKRPVLKFEDIDPEGLISILGGLYGNLSLNNVKKHTDKFKNVFYQNNDNSLSLSCNDLHFHKEEQAEDFKILLCSALRCKLRDLETRLAGNNFIHALNSYYKPVEFGYNEQKFIDLIEDYDILRDASLPEYKWTDGKTEEEYLLELCRIGYKQRKLSSWDQSVYGARVKEELDVIQKYGLTGYFLIVVDYIKWAKKYMLVGPSRGSACGSLVCYLLGITEIDPIPNNLIFARFLNEGRFSEGHIEYPDIDIDFPPTQRENVVNYIRDKYGEDLVSQVVTFGRMMGATILTEVMSAHNAISFEQIKELTKLIPTEASVLDQLKATHTKSVIQLMLEFYPDKLSDYCMYKEGKYIGEYARYFEQAIRLEGTFKNQGKHAAGLVIAPETTSLNCPMIYDKNTEYKIAGLDMDALKKVGFIKFDILGVRALEEIFNIFRIVGDKNGHMFRNNIT